MGCRTPLTPHEMQTNSHAIANSVVAQRPRVRRVVEQLSLSAACGEGVVVSIREDQALEEHQVWGVADAGL